MLSTVLDLAAVGLAAEQVGGAQFVLEMAVQYAKDRVQFGRPIGSFQAIKHKCADMLLEVESAKSAAYYGLWCAAEMNDELPSVASLAKAYCSEAYFHATAENIQIHGGIGFTWEHPAHLYFKRAKSSELLFGDPTYHRELPQRKVARRRQHLVPRRHDVPALARRAPGSRDVRHSSVDYSASCSLLVRADTWDAMAVSTTSSSRPITSMSTWRCQRVASDGRSCTGPGRASAIAGDSRQLRWRSFVGPNWRRFVERWNDDLQRQPVNDGNIEAAVELAASSSPPAPGSPLPPRSTADRDDSFYLTLERELNTSYIRHLETTLDETEQQLADLRDAQPSE